MISFRLHVSQKETILCMQLLVFEAVRIGKLVTCTQWPRLIGEYLEGSTVFSSPYVRHLLNKHPEGFGNGSLQSSQRKAL